MVLVMIFGIHGDVIGRHRVGVFQIKINQFLLILKEITFVLKSGAYIILHLSS